MYSVVAGGLAGLFLVDGSSGHLTLTSPLDYEARHTYEVIVGGQAAGERAFARVVVRVRDVNDLPPTFSRPLFETQITEEDDRHLPKPILQVTFKDLHVLVESPEGKHATTHSHTQRNCLETDVLRLLGDKIGSLQRHVQMFIRAKGEDIL
ncbi:putative neural-cadherin 2, partial [Penaeus japonicus]|uniref:putative neural-cadherin 2 n=1 Tax=Penaeus japonicus TaxID=27405 RepID=UPI001C70CB84